MTRPTPTPTPTPRMELDFKNLEGSPYSVGRDSTGFYWNAVIQGPDGSPYCPGIFHIGITFPTNYPFLPPMFLFKTSIFHPNFITNGVIDLDILGIKWSPAMTVYSVLDSIVSLLTEPNLDYPIDTEAAELFMNNRSEFRRRAREFTDNQKQT